MPWVACLVITFALLVALSLIVFGMHYPMDVIAGAILGVLPAKVSINLVGGYVAGKNHQSSDCYYFYQL